MAFVSITSGHSYDCLSDAVENYHDSFARRVSLGGNLKFSDFKTDHERGKLPDEETSEEVCACRGVSIDMWDSDSKNAVEKNFNTTMRLSPGLKKQLGVFKIKQDAGLVKYTPQQRTGYNPHHFDFYKSDDFAIDMLEVICMIKPNV